MDPREEQRRRQLVRSLSRAASALDKTLFGMPSDRAMQLNYQSRLLDHEKQWRQELAALKVELDRL